MTNNFEKDINVPSKRLDRIDKMEIDLANYEQMERDIEKIIEPYQLNWELDCLSLPTAIQSILERKEQECEELEEKFDKALDKWNKFMDKYQAENEKLKVWKSITPLKTKMLVKALTEIKEIITKSCIDVDDNDYIHLSHMKQILQKCEVLDE